MLSYEKKIDIARRKVADLSLVDNPKKLREDETLYFVDDLDKVKFAYVEDLDNLTDVYDNSPTEDIEAAIKEYFTEDLEQFLNRHNIAFK